MRAPLVFRHVLVARSRQLLLLRTNNAMIVRCELQSASLPNTLILLPSWVGCVVWDQDGKEPLQNKLDEQ